MKRMIAAAAGLVLVAGAAFADPIVGTWKTQKDGGAYAHIKITPCGKNFCGIIAKSFNSSGEYKSPNNGKMLVRNMSATGGGNYKGKVWRPSNNKIYIGKAKISGKKMVLKGCVAGGLLCTGQTWTKIR